MDAVNNFLLFGFNTYYPQGGIHDLLGTFPTLEAARTFLGPNPDDGVWVDHAHAYSISEGRIVVAWRADYDGNCWTLLSPEEDE